MDTYTQLVEKIARLSNMTVRDIDLRVESKKAKLSGLISKEGAAQIVAAELGISFENERYKLNELTNGLRRASVVGKIVRIFPVREFNKNGKAGKVASFILGDETSTVRVALWDTNHIALVEKKEITEGTVVEIRRASVKNDELHLSAFSDIVKSSEIINGVKERAPLTVGSFKDAIEGNAMQVRAYIVQTFEPRYFDSKRVEGEKGVLLNLVLDDGSATMRTVLFGEHIKALFAVTDSDLMSLEVLNDKRSKILGEEFWFTGMYRMNSFSNSLEFSIQGLNPVIVETLLAEMEAKA